MYIIIGIWIMFYFFSVTFLCQDLIGIYFELVFYKQATTMINDQRLTYKRLELKVFAKSFITSVTLIPSVEKK